METDTVNSNSGILEEDHSEANIDLSSDINENNSLDNIDESFLDLQNSMEISDDSCEFESLDNEESKEALEHYRDLWIPSSRTQRLLAMNIPYSHFPFRDLLTFPEICEEKVTDRFEQLVTTLDETGTVSFNIPNIQSVSQDECGLLELVQKEAFRSAADLTAQLLMAHRLGFGKNNEPRCHSPKSTQLWFARLAFLVKIKEFELAEKEASLWGDCDKPDLYYQFYPDIYPGRSGSIVPFQMRLLLANLSSFCGQYTESLKKLFSILAIVRKIHQNIVDEVTSLSEISSTGLTAAKRLWGAREKRVLTSIVNVAIQMKDFILAVEIVNRMIEDESRVKKRHILYSLLGRIYLQFGDLMNAEKFFLMVQSDVGRPFSDDVQDFQNIINQGLLAIARNDFQEGYKYFEKASFIDPSSLMVMNNCAVCLFYLGHLGEAIRLLNGAINNDPLHALQDCLMLNLCTMYDLNISDCRAKKLELLKFSRLFQTDLINLFSFRLV